MLVSIDVRGWASSRSYFMLDTLAENEYALNIQYNVLTHNVLTDNDHTGGAGKEDGRSKVCVLVKRRECMLAHPLDRAV